MQDPNFVEIDVNSRTEVFELMSWWKKEKVLEAKVMVIGAGALGNEVLKNLALLNVGHIFIVDYDDIEFSNLSRSLLFRESDAKSKSLKCEVAARRVKEMNPEVKVMAYNANVNYDIGLGVFRQMDAIIGCLDNRLARLAINRACFKVNKPWIDGAIENLAGQAIVYVPKKYCYECELSEREKKLIRFSLSCPDVAQRSIVAGRIPTTPISASIIGAVQAQEALKLIHNYDEFSEEGHFRSLKGKMFRYEGMSLESGSFQIEPPDEECSSHEYYENIVEAQDLSSESTVAELLDWVKTNLKEEKPDIPLRQRFIYELTPEFSGKTIAVKLPAHKVADYIEDNQLRTNFREEIFQKGTDIIDIDFPFPETTLKEIGIPPLEILKVETDKDVFYIELAGDKNFIRFE